MQGVGGRALGRVPHARRARARARRARQRCSSPRLHAGVRRVVLALPLLAVVVPHVVRVLLLELLRGDLLAELGAPEEQRVLQAEAGALEEQAELHAPVVAQVVVVLEVEEEVAHAERGGLLHRRAELRQGQAARAAGRAACDGEEGAGGGLGVTAHPGARAAALCERSLNRRAGGRGASPGAH